MKYSRFFALCLLLSLAVSFLILTPNAYAEAQGANLLVTRLDDPAPNGCAPSDCSLREAVIASNLTAGTDVISITIPGTIELSIVGADENSAATGDLDLIDDVYILGQGAEVTIVDANGIDRVFDYISVAQHHDPNVTPNGVPNSIEDMTITGGEVIADTEVIGGGVRVGNGRDTGLFGVVVRNNTGSSDSWQLGGGVGNNGGSLVLYNSAVINNSAQNAAGVANLAGTLRIVNSTISGNSAGGAVGGVLNIAFTSDVTATLIISDSTIAYNVELSPDGSGAGLDTTAVAGTAIASISNSIVANNSGEAQCFFGGSGVGTMTSAGYNLSSDASCNFTAGSDLQDSDPLLGALVQEDGTYYHALSNGSPALDSGSAFLNVDQRGLTRPVDLPGIPNSSDGSDRGAIEMEAEPPTAVALAHLSVIGSDGFTRGAIAIVALAALGILIALRRR